MRRLLLALLAVSLLGGCGGADSSLFATAVRSTQAAGGAEIAFQGTVEAAGQSIVINGSGVVEGDRAQMTMDVPGAGQMEIRADGLVMYMHSDLFGAALGGKEWMKLDMERAGESLGIDMGAMSGGQSSPAEQLKMLEKVSGGITDEGREQIRGVETTHYRATIDLSKDPMFDKLSELTGQTEMPVDVWIDGQQRVRRMEWEQVMRQAGVEAHAKIVMEFVRFGVPVDIDIPDDDEAFDAT